MEAWLSRITTNAFLDEVRRKKRRPLEVVPDLPDRVLGAEQEPLDVLDTSRLPDHIQDALKALPDRVPQRRGAVRRGRPELPGDRRVARRPRRHRPQPHPPRPRPAQGDARMTTLPPPESFDVLSAYLDGELTRARGRPGRRPARAQPRAPRRAGSGRAGPHVGASAAARRAPRWLPRARDRRGRAAAGPGRRSASGGCSTSSRRPRSGSLVLGFVNMSRSHDVSPDAANAGADAHRGIGRLRRPPRIARRRPARAAGRAAGGPRPALLGAALVAGRARACARCRSTATSSASCTPTTPTS